MASLEAVFIFAAILVAIVTSITELIKITFPGLPKNLIPVLAFLLGITVGILAYPFTDLALEFRVWAGVFAGLAATGLFELAFNPRPGTASDK